VLGTCLLLLAGRQWRAGVAGRRSRRREADEVDEVDEVDVVDEVIARSRHPDVERAYRRFADALGDTATPCGPAETLSDLGQRVPQVRAALAVVERSRYDRRDLPAPEQRAAIAALDSVAAAVRTGALRE
jgi:hypothetical protein